MKSLRFLPIPLALLASPVFAQGVLPTCTKNGSCSADEIITLINNIVQWGVGISGALALLMFVIGGVFMLFSAGSQSRVERGKDIVIGTTISLIYILGSWLIINFTLEALSSEYRLSGDYQNTTSQNNIAGCCEMKTGAGVTICLGNQEKKACEEYAAKNNYVFENLHELKICGDITSCSGNTIP